MGWWDGSGGGGVGVLTCVDSKWDNHLFHVGVGLEIKQQHVLGKHREVLSVASCVESL